MVQKKRANRTIGAVIGIDEVGRGPLAGPVVVGAVYLPPRFRLPHDIPAPLQDSKKLTPARRESWARYIKKLPRVRWALAQVSPREIDRTNISRAANGAARKALGKLAVRDRRSCRIYLDGGLYLGSRAEMPKNARTVVKGDERIPAISMASIIAKVYRDKLMERLHKKHPHYGFAAHKGYGTASHRLALKKHGPSPAHRRTFLSHIV